MERKFPAITGTMVGVAVVAFAGFYLMLVGTGSTGVSTTLQIGALLVGFVLFAAAAVTLFRSYTRTPLTMDAGEFEEPAFVKFLFSSPKSAPLWLGMRIFLGYEWLHAGWGKLNNPAWMDGGAALQGYWTNATAVPETGRAPITYDAFRAYIQFMLDNEWYTWFAKVVVFGELLIGLGLIVGALTGIAAFFGALLNMSFMLAGTVSTNPVLFSLSILIILAWRVAGLIGLDRWLLPILGVPWRAGSPTVPATGPLSPPTHG